MNQYDPQAMNEIVTGFVRFIDRRHRNNEIYDSKNLPWPKATIIDLCLRRLKSEKNQHIRRTITDSLLCAPFYQEGVGMEAMQECRFDLFTMDIASLDEDKLRRMKLTIAEHLPQLESEKFMATLRLVQEEFNLLNKTCELLEQEHELSPPPPDAAPTV